MLAEVTRVNQQIHALAKVLNSPSHPELAAVESSNPDVPVAHLTKSTRASLFVFAVAMREGKTEATFTLTAGRDARVEVLGEHRTLEAEDGVFTDTFADWDVHLYRIRTRR
jgi:hypothetical protein